MEKCPRCGWTMDDDTDEFIKRLKERSDALTPESARALLVEEGVIDQDGNLLPPYAPEK